MSTETATGTTLFRHEPDAMVVSAGTVIFSVGDAPDGMYVVQEGEVDLVISGVNVETVGPTGVFGEMGLVDGLPRSATATARTDAKLVCVDELRPEAHDRRESVLCADRDARHRCPPAPDG
jgi:hypothetical protein